MIIIGENEVLNKTITLRDKKKVLNETTLEEVIEKLRNFDKA